MFGSQTFVIAFGSNYLPEKNIQRAIFSVEAQVGKLKLSSAYWSKAVNISGDDFINVVTTFENTESSPTIRSCIKDIEAGLNHSALRLNHRSIDIDLLLHGNHTDTKLPHPDIENFLFIAHPLAELFPEHKHPTFKKSFKQIATGLSNQMQLTLATGLL